MPYVKKRRVVIPEDILSDEKILAIADGKIQSIGKKMTPLQGVFYLRLVRHSFDSGIRTKDGDYMVLLSHDEMCFAFNQGKTFISLALSLFTSAGLIERRKMTKSEKNAIFGPAKGFGNCIVTKIPIKIFATGDEYVKL